MENILEQVLQIVFSAKRAMPAHFSSNGTRTQSFCVDFAQLPEDEDYNMASESYHSLYQYISEKSNLSKEQNMSVLRCGEDVMIGAYIISKLGRKDLVADLKNIIIKAAIDAFSSHTEGLEEKFHLSEVAIYFNHCAEFGEQMAEIKCPKCSSFKVKKEEDKNDFLHVKPEEEPARRDQKDYSKQKYYCHDCSHKWEENI